MVIDPACPAYAVKGDDEVGCLFLPAVSVPPFLFLPDSLLLVHGMTTPLSLGHACKRKTRHVHAVVVMRCSGCGCGECLTSCTLAARRCGCVCWMWEACGC